MSSDQPGRLCPHCNEMHPVNAKFCPSTGKGLESVDDICPHCSKPILEYSGICPHCNNPLPIPESRKRPLELFINKQLAKIFFTSLIYIGALMLIAGIFLWLLDDDRFATGEKTSALSTNNPSEAAIPTRLSSASTPARDLAQESDAHAAHTQTLVQTTIAPTTEPLLTPTLTQTERPTATDESFTLSDNPADGAKMVLVPTGEFIMGSSSDVDPYFWGAEGPQHRVHIDEFWIYRTEVTNSMYQKCVAEQKCPRPVQTYGPNTDNYYSNPRYADYPVIYVSYTHAYSYCQWVGGRLPTEAEWEKAARGTDGRLFPWGDQSPNSLRANLCDSSCDRGAAPEQQIHDGHPNIAPVGSFPAGNSAYGALDMAGNVWEWTIDWFDAGYYSISPDTNPYGPASGTKRVIRGGCWTNSIDGIRTVARMSLPPDDTLDTLGFRCVIEIPDT